MCQDIYDIVESPYDTEDLDELVFPHYSNISRIVEDDTLYGEVVLSDKSFGAVKELLNRKDVIDLLHHYENDENHGDKDKPGPQWVKYDADNQAHYPLIFKDVNGEEVVAKYVRHWFKNEDTHIFGTMGKNQPVYGTQLFA